MRRIDAEELPRPARLISLATAVPAFVIDQAAAKAQSRVLFGSRMRDFDRLAQVFETTGIERRYSVRPVPWFSEEHGWPDRTEAYVAGASELFERVTRKALSEANLEPRDIDAVVTVSSTGVATPSLEARILPGMGFRPDVERTPVFGLGCAGGVTGLAIASRLASARPGTTVLLVAVELCTLAFRLDRATKADIIATSLFGDGAAAAIVSSDDDLAAIANFSGATEHLWPDTLDIMGWSVDPEGLGVIFDRAIPPFAEKNIGLAIAGILDRAGLRPADIDRFACHPGGAKVITALERALSLEQGALDHERTVLADFGNMSAPTALFVLERLIQAGLPSRTLLSAMGPGFSVSSVSLRRAA